ncbi:MAG: BrnA antitoxin family protein [Moraxellaceae bacterium]
MSNNTTRPKILIPTKTEDQQLLAAALADPDAQPLKPEQLSQMQPLRAVRGRPKSEAPKQLVSVRYSPEVLDFFKSSGAGWQARMDAVLLGYVKAQKTS